MRSARLASDYAEARACAVSAIELGLLYVKQDANWRTNRPNGVWLQDQPLGSGHLTLEGIDPTDGDLTNSLYNPLLLTGVGVKGMARHKTQITLVAEGGGVTCLEGSLHAGTDLSFDSATVQSGQKISANNSVTAVSSTINADVEAVGTISGSTYNGTRTTGIQPRTMPGSTVFDWYVSNGTPIDYADLAGNGLIDIVLSPGNNPYGTHQTNPQGIYVLDCLGSSLGIQRCRIVGTLVVLHAGSSSAIMGEVNFEPAVSNYPVLLVSGNMRFQIYSTGTLNEAVLSVNFNPFGTPYQGSEDDDLLDIYPCAIKGLVYISGNSLMQASPVFDGVVVIGNTLTTMSTPVISLTYRSTFVDNPPPGFGGTPTLKISPYSRKQVIDE